MITILFLVKIQAFKWLGSLVVEGEELLMQFRSDYMIYRTSKILTIVKEQEDA